MTTQQINTPAKKPVVSYLLFAALALVSIVLLTVGIFTLFRFDALSAGEIVALVLLLSADALLLSTLIFQLVRTKTDIDRNAVFTLVSLCNVAVVFACILTVPSLWQIYYSVQWLIYLVLGICMVFAAAQLVLILTGKLQIGQKHLRKMIVLNAVLPSIALLLVVPAYIVILAAYA